MKQIIHKNHSPSASHHMMVTTILGRKIKMTYEAYNAVERCSIKLFDGNEFNSLFEISDIDKPKRDAYNILSPDEREKRALMLFKKAEDYCKFLLL